MNENTFWIIYIIMVFVTFIFMRITRRTVDNNDGYFLIDVFASLLWLFVFILLVCILPFIIIDCTIDGIRGKKK